jgi:hypothetical protein
MQHTLWARLGAKQEAASNTDVALHRITNSVSKSLGKRNILKSVTDGPQWDEMNLYEARTAPLK